MTRTIGAGLLVAAAAVAALSGCSSGSPGASPTSSATADPQQALNVGRNYAQCVRTHGQPNFPDPVIQDGRLNFGADNQAMNKDAMIAAQDACGAILQQLPPSMLRQEQAPPSAQDMQHLQQFAQCMRAHGLPEWPDPKPDGTFPIANTPLGTEGKSQRFIDAGQACKQYWDKRISMS